MVSAWLQFVGPVPSSSRHALAALLARSGVDAHDAPKHPLGPGLVVFDQADDAVLDCLRSLPVGSTALAVAIGTSGPDSASKWRVLDAGAADLLSWAALPEQADDVASRLQRWQTIGDLVESDAVRSRLAGDSPAWRSTLCGVVEVANLTTASVLITGETGTVL